MDNNEKFLKAVQTLKSGVQMAWHGQINTEEDFNKVEWVTGVENDTSITTTTCPHSEITWTLVKAEMDKL